jgi:adenosylmethionine-8-amino-7-oxononanoate aminotransferase
LAEKLLTILPDNQSKIFYSDDGSTAVEVALKMAIQFWNNRGVGKKRIIAIEGAYHGDTFGAMSVGSRGLFTNPFSDLLFDVSFIPFPQQENENLSVDSFKKLVRNNDVAVFIYEPLVQGASGMRMYSAETLDNLLTVAKENKILCIADEVFTGFGRTGKLFASRHMKNQPDIMALSKGITGGALPLGATSCSDLILSAFETDDFSKTFFHGHSYTANPLACAAANASHDILIRAETKERINEITFANSEFVSHIGNNRMVKDARCMGTILAVEIETDSTTGYSNELRKKIYDYFLCKNILLRPLGNVIYVVPPYVISRVELELVFKSIEEFLNVLSKEAE